MNSTPAPSQLSDDVTLAIENLQSLNPRLRSQAVEDLGKLRAVSATDALIDLMDEDVNTYVRSACAEALGHIGDHQAVFPLIDALRDNCSFVRRAATIALGQMRAKEAQGSLIQALEDPNFYVRRAAINAIGKLGLPELGTTLLPFLETNDPRLQRTTIIALRRLRTEKTVPPMIAMLKAFLHEPNHRDLPVVKTLVIALGELNAVEAVPVLIDILRGYVGARSLAATALAEIGDPKAIPSLQDALADKSINLQLAAMKSLGQLQGAGALPSIIDFMQSTDPRVRRTAALTIGTLQVKETAQQLLEMARNDTSPLVRPAAIEAIGLLGDANMIPLLLPMASDSNAYLRAALAHTLSSLDGESPEVKKVLKNLTNDKVEHVVIAAQRALDKCDQQSSHLVAEQDDCAKPEQKHISWLRRFLGRNP